MKSFFLSQAQRERVPLDGDLKECRAQVKEIAHGELKRARARYGKAYLHHDGDCYLITLSPDRRSAMWTSLALVIV